MDRSPEQTPGLAAARGKYLASLIIFGTIGLLLRRVGLPSELVAMCRGVIGAGFVLLLMLVRGRRPDGAAIRRNLPWLILSGACLGLNWLFLFAGYLQNVAVTSLCNYTAPVIVVLVAPILLKERLDRRKLPCVAAALAGVVLISGVTESGQGNLFGIAMGMAAALGFVGMLLCNRKLRDISGENRTLVQLATAALTVAPYALFKNAGAELQVDVASVLLVLLMGAVHTGAAFDLYFSGIGALPVQTVAVLGYLEPVVCVLCAVLILHEPLAVSGWLGAALILGAAIVSETLPEPKNAGKTADDAETEDRKTNFKKSI